MTESTDSGAHAAPDTTPSGAPSGGVDLEQRAGTVPADASGEPPDMRTADRAPRVKRPRAQKSVQTDEDRAAGLAKLRDEKGWTWAELADNIEALGGDAAGAQYAREQALSDFSRPVGDPWGYQPQPHRVPVNADAQANMRGLRVDRNWTWREMADQAVVDGGHQALVDWMLDEHDKDPSRPVDTPDGGPVARQFGQPLPLGQQVPSRVPNPAS